ncbi:hypothetical protein ACK3TF_005262 [Chlorella vulgaris]
MPSHLNSELTHWLHFYIDTGTSRGRVGLSLWRPHISRAVSTPAEAGYEWDSMDREQRECAKAFLREPTNTKPQKKPKLSTQANKRLGMKGWPRRQLQQQEQGSSSDEEISEMSDG